MKALKAILEIIGFTLLMILFWAMYVLASYADAIADGRM
jgi:hypothetical protein